MPGIATSLGVVPGERFGRLTVLHAARRQKPRRPEHTERVAWCRCDCGTETAAIAVTDLKTGHTTSCGCRIREVAREHGRSQKNLDMLAAARPVNTRRLRERMTTHGLARHPLYHTWWGMLQRCENPASISYRRYGDRGIAVCEEWHDVTAFITWIEANLGPRPEGMTLDRVDGNGDYQPGNVQWADWIEQQGKKEITRQVDDRRQAAQPLRAAGMTYTQIGAQLGISADVARYVLKRSPRHTRSHAIA